METNYIFGESGSGAVNGINKVFTLSNTIDKIEEVYIGGSIYRSFSFTGNTITLTDAPSTDTGAPSIDYWKV